METREDVGSYESYNSVRRDILILLLVGWALAIILWNLVAEAERYYACVNFGQGCESTYKPASEESRPYRP